MRKVLLTCLMVAFSGARLSYGIGAGEAVDPGASPNVEERLAELSRQILLLKGENESLRTQVAALSKSLEQVATKDGENYIPNVRAAMEKSPSFRKDLYDVTGATVEIHNNSGGPQELFLNGARWTFPTGVWNVDVPYGAVRIEFVHLQGDREPWIYREKDWKHDGNHARLPIQILMGRARPTI